MLLIRMNLLVISIHHPMIMAIAIILQLNYQEKSFRQVKMDYLSSFSIFTILTPPMFTILSKMQVVTIFSLLQADFMKASRTNLKNSLQLNLTRG
jgi:hypothetical protein